MGRVGVSHTQGNGPHSQNRTQGRAAHLSRSSLGGGSSPQGGKRLTREKMLVPYVLRAYGGLGGQAAQGGSSGQWNPPCDSTMVGPHHHPRVHTLRTPRAHCHWGLWVTMSCRRRFHWNKCPPLAWDVSSGDRGVRAILLGT